MPNKLLDKRNIFYLLNFIFYLLIILNFASTDFLEYIWSNIFIPVSLFLLSISIFYIALTYCIGRKYIKTSSFLIVVVIAFILSCVSWIFQSYNSYYSGVIRNVIAESSLLYYLTKEILYSDMKENVKKDILFEAYKKSRAEIIVRKNGYNYIYTRHKKLTSGYHIYRASDINLLKQIHGRAADIEDDNNFVGFRPIKINDSIYTFKYSYANRPYLHLGLLKAVTWSFMQDREIRDRSNKSYLFYNIQGRSYSFWIPFSAILAVFTFILYVNGKLSLELKQKQIELNEQYESAGLYQELLLKSLVKQFNNIIASQAKTSLQQFIADHNLDNKKQVQNENGITKTFNHLYKVIQSKVHDLKNEWNKQSGGDEQILEMISIILKDLQGLKYVFHIEMSDFSIEEVSQIVSDSIDNRYYKSPGLEFNYEPVQIEDKLKDFVVLCNRYRLKSIIENLLGNAANAVDRYKNSLDGDERRKFRRYIALKTEISVYNNLRAFTITVEDNGGGFSDLKNIYKKPVVSSNNKLEKRMGEGTVYINFFVSRMNGIIEANNIINKDGNCGAQTKIFLPLKSNLTIKEIKDE